MQKSIGIFSDPSRCTSVPLFLAPMVRLREEGLPLRCQLNWRQKFWSSSKAVKSSMQNSFCPSLDGFLRAQPCEASVLTVSSRPHLFKDKILTSLGVARIKIVFSPHFLLFFFNGSTITPGPTAILLTQSRLSSSDDESWPASRWTWMRVYSWSTYFWNVNLQITVCSAPWEPSRNSPSSEAIFPRERSKETTNKFQNKREEFEIIFINPVPDKFCNIFHFLNVQLMFT